MQSEHNIGNNLDYQNTNNAFESLEGQIHTMIFPLWNTFRNKTHDNGLCSFCTWHFFVLRKISFKDRV